MSVKLYNKATYAGGQGKTTVNKDSTTPANPTISGEAYPLLIAPNSLLQTQTTAAQPGGVDAGHALANLTGSHDWTGADVTDGLVDNLNGANIVELLDENGVPMLSYDKTAGTPTTDGIYVGAVGKAGVGATTAPYETTTPETVSVSSGAAMLSQNMKANILVWICVRIPGATDTAIPSWTPYQEVGFDYGGANRLTKLGAGQSTAGSVSCMMCDGASYNYVCGAMSDNTAGAANGEYTSFAKGNVGGIHVKMFAINPGANNYGRTIDGNGNISGPVAPVTGATGTEWVNNTGPDGTMINLGDNTPDGFGIYSMGIKNFDGDIPEFEVINAATFMHKTGLLPPWW